MSNSPDHIESFFNFLDVDSYLDLSLKGYELGDESLFQNYQQPENQVERQNENSLGAATFQQEPAQEEGFKFPSLLTVHQEAEMEKQKEEDFVKEKNFDSFDNLNSVFCCSQTSKKIDKKVKRNESKFKSLAIRNIKCNFAASLENFIEFLMQKNLLQCNPAKNSKFMELKNYIHSQLKSLRGFQGWKDLWLHPLYGSLARKISYYFFQNSFADTYIAFAKIKEEYKQLYQQSILAFVNGISHPSNFTSFSLINKHY